MHRATQEALIYWSTPRFTVGLIVKEGRVIDAPPIARWALGRRVESLHLRGTVSILSDNDVDWGSQGEPEQVSGAPAEAYGQAQVAWPELSDDPHEHRLSITLKGRDDPWVVLHVNTAQEANSLLDDLTRSGTFAALAESISALRAQWGIIQGLGPVTAVTPPPSGPAPQGPNDGPPWPPNVSVPGAPGYVGPPVGGPPPAQQSQPWGQSQGNQRQGKPQPPGFRHAEIPWAQKDAFKQLREQLVNSGQRGKIVWGGGGTWWIDPSIAQWVAQQGFPVQ